MTWRGRDWQHLQSLHCFCYPIISSEYYFHVCVEMLHVLEGCLSVYTTASTQTGPASHWPGITPCESLVENATLFQETKWHVDYRLQKWQCALHISGSSVPVNIMKSRVPTINALFFVVRFILLLMILRWFKRFCCKCIWDTIYTFFLLQFLHMKMGMGNLAGLASLLFAVTKKWKWL